MPRYRPADARGRKGHIQAAIAHDGHHHHDETQRINTGHGVVVLSIFEDGVPPWFQAHFEDRGRPVSLPPRAGVVQQVSRHLPLNRQSDIYAHEDIVLDVSTLADWVGACAATLAPLVDEIEKHVAAEQIHTDMLQACLRHDTTVPVLAKNQCTVSTR